MNCLLYNTDRFKNMLMPASSIVNADSARNQIINKLSMVYTIYLYFRYPIIGMQLPEIYKARISTFRAKALFVWSLIKVKSF
jgi:hypothetical protein